jgi:hypothetical protein
MITDRSSNHGEDGEHRGGILPTNRALSLFFSVLFVLSVVYLPITATSARPNYRSLGAKILRFETVSPKYLLQSLSFQSTFAG